MPAPPLLLTSMIAKWIAYLLTLSRGRRSAAASHGKLLYTAPSISLARILYLSRMIMFATGCKRLQPSRGRSPTAKNQDFIAQWHAKYLCTRPAPKHGILAPRFDRRQGLPWR